MQNRIEECKVETKNYEELRAKTLIKLVFIIFYLDWNKLELLKLLLLQFKPI